MVLSPFWTPSNERRKTTFFPACQRLALRAQGRFEVDAVPFIAATALLNRPAFVGLHDACKKVFLIGGGDQPKRSKHKRAGVKFKHRQRGLARRFGT